MFTLRPEIKYRQQGVSLIEIMIALIIGLILTAGAIQIFISSKATYRLESALSRLQENGRFIVDLIANDIRMAGYNGCSSRGELPINVIAKNPPPVDISAENAVRGYDGNGAWSPAIPANMLVAMTDIDGDASKDVIAGIDVIQVQRASECGATVVGNWEVASAQEQVASQNDCGFVQYQVVTITDCKAADVFAIQNTPNQQGGGANPQTLTHSQNLNTDNFLSQNYGPDSQVYVQVSNSYFIAPGTSGDNAFYRATWTPDDNPAVSAADFQILELADGVEDMQILYGVDNGGGNEYADEYVTAAAVEAADDWLNVRSVRINLLLYSPDRITEEPRTINFNGATVGGGDRRLRMVYSNTITLRNRLP